MRRVVLDANVLISGVLSKDRPESTMGQLMRAWELRRFHLIVSPPLIEEVERNLTRLRFGGRVATADMDAFVLLLRQFAELTPLTVAVHGVATHPEDDLMLATAVSAAAEALVTGDKGLLQLGAHLGVVIVSPRAFLTSLASP